MEKQNIKTEHILQKIMRQKFEQSFEKILNKLTGKPSLTLLKLVDPTDPVGSKKGRSYSLCVRT